MMKNCLKKSSCLILILLSGVFMLTGCGAKASVANFPSGQLAKEIVQNHNFSTELHAIDEEIARVYFEVDDSVQLSVYLSNAGSEMVAAFSYEQEEAEENVKQAISNFLANQKMSFQGYSPEDVEKINHAAVLSSGHNTVAVVADNIEEVEKLVGDIFNGTLLLSSEDENVVTQTFDEKETSGRESADESTGEETTAVQDETTTQAIEIPVLYKEGAIKTYKGVTVVGDTGYAFFGYNENMMTAYTDALKKLATTLEGEATVYSVPIPMSGGITFPDNLAGEQTYLVQKNALSEMERMFEDKVKLVNMNEILMQHRDEYLYFRTDHHWTALGAYYGYREFCRKKNITPNELDSYETKVFPGFCGTYCYAEDGSIQDMELYQNPDTVTAYLPHDSSTLHIVNRDGSEFDWDVIYDVSTASAGSKYITFGVGDYPLATVHNENKHDGSACIVVKDSFGNAFVPFLVDHYEYIYGIDYRYGKEKLADFAREHNVSDILFVVAMIHTGNGYAVGRMQEFCQ